MNTLLLKDYRLERLTESGVDTAKRLCDEFVGQGLYGKTHLRQIIPDDTHLFYLVMKGDVPVGYFYAQSLRAGDISRLPGLSYDVIASLCEPDAEIGVCRSIGIREAYRGSGLSDALLLLFKNYFETVRLVPLILVPAWSKNGDVPAAKLLTRCGFHYLADLKTPWADHPTLQCAACGQTPCSCDAVVYYSGGVS
ncbi:MAG TPA: hypothetical protein GXZ64_06090 [Clostridiaceae bacterium]|nr:hypothetical protein [Clostridiaceae bacterium]